MRSTSRFLSILILIVTPFLAACTQIVDIYFHSDESWKVKPRLNFSPQEMMLFRGVIQNFLARSYSLALILALAGIIFAIVVLVVYARFRLKQKNDFQYL